MPYWVDPARLERGSRAYHSVGTDVVRIAVMGLSMSYLAQDTNEVQLRSGDLQTKAGPRAAETLSCVAEITRPASDVP